MSPKKKTGDELAFIKPLLENNGISRKEILQLSKIDYPLFSFRYLNEESFSGCTDCKFLSGVLTRLHKLSELGWNNIRISTRHGFGMESIPVEEISGNLPSIVTPEIKKLHLLRDNGDNRVMIGLQQSKIFHIILICTNFKDYYTHGKRK